MRWEGRTDLIFDYDLGLSKFLKGKGGNKKGGEGLELDVDGAAATGGGSDGGFLVVAEPIIPQVEEL